MKTTIDKSLLQQEPWFKTWFDTAYYHKLYQSRNEQEASDFINALLHYLHPAPGSHMLDLACGNGRHSIQLAQKGFKVTGLDLAFSSICVAKKRATTSLQFRQHDMREPFGIACYEYIFNFFTSFGYFENDQENNVVMSNITNALKQHGFVLFDYLNVAYTEKNLIPVEEKELDGTLYHINRWSTDSFIYKRIAINEPGLQRPLEYIEKVARFSLCDFERFFSVHALQTVQVFGGYDLSPYNANHSKRLIILAQKV
jgi:SAM-dependent methyltransferase